MTTAIPLPSVDETIPPRLHEIGAYRFQRFVTDLFGHEPEIATSSEYGVNGQGDRGVDVIARRRDGDDEVASCKCYETTTPAQVRKWSDEFLKHWSAHWRDRGIRRFVLATTACNTARRQIQDQIGKERERFKALGIAYEFWTPSTIVRKAGPHRVLVMNYLSEEWAVRICGRMVEPGLTTSPGSALVSEALIGQMLELQRRFSRQALRAVDRAIADLRAGRTGVVRSFVDEQRREENWPQLEASAQARILRLAASLAVRDEDVALAERLSAEADAITPADEPRIAAHVALLRSGPSRALDVLGTVTTAAGLQLRIALLVMTGDVESAEAVLGELASVDPGDAETIRMQALVALAADRREEALEHMVRAEAIAPEWTAVRQLGAMIRYACALSPAVPPAWFLAPNAFDGSFVRDDVVSQARLEDALLLLDLLVMTEPDVVHHRMWRLAVLSSIRARRDRARDEADGLLILSDDDPTVVAWCVFRGIDVDLERSERVLLDRYECGADLSTVRVLGILLARRGEPIGAETLRRSLAIQSGDARDEAMDWIGRLDAAGSVEDPSARVLRRARVDGDWGPAAIRLAELFAAAKPNPEAMQLSEGVAAAGRVAMLVDHVAALLAFRSAAAVRLAVDACYRSGDAPRALALLEAHEAEFGIALPSDMRRLRAAALESTGDLPAALREADAIAGSGSAGDRLFRAELVIRTGNLRAAIPDVRGALDAGLLTGDHALRWSRLLQAEERTLSRELFDRAVATDLDDRYAAAAMHDALRLQAEGAIEALTSRVHARAAKGASDVRLLTVDELPRLLAEQKSHDNELDRIFLDGAIPVHLRFADDPTRFALLYLGPNSQPGGGMNAWPIRHGARQAAVAPTAPWSSWRLHMDLTALLVAARLDLLDFVETNPNGVRVSAATPMALLAMELGCREHGDATIPERILASSIRPSGIDEVDATVVVTRHHPSSAGDSPRSSVSLAALVGALRGRHAIVEEDAARILDGLPDAGGDVPPADGAALLLDAEALHRLAAADALTAVAARYDLRCDGTLLDEAIFRRDQAATACRIVGTLTALRDRVAAGFASGLYRTIPAAALDAGRDDEEDGEPGETPLTLCLRDVIAAPGLDGAVAWIDDRLLTGYPRTASMPVVGVAEVLEALVAERRLAPRRRDRALDDLRSAGALFMMPSPTEVLHALRAAPRHGQVVVETPDLAAKRRAIAHSAAHEVHLAVGLAQSDRPDETQPLHAGMRLLATCLKAIWLDETLTFDARVACSDWLWLNARRKRLGRSMPDEDTRDAQPRFEIMQIAHCLDQAVDIGMLDDRRGEVRECYLRWLWLRVVETIADVDDTVVPRLGGYLADFYAALLASRDAHGVRDRRVMRTLIARRIRALPEVVQTELYRDRRMAAIGVCREAITIGSMSFAPEVLWRETRRALKYGRGRLRAEAGPTGRRLLVRLRRDGRNVIMTGAVRVTLEDPTLWIACLDGETRSIAIAELVRDLRLDAVSADRAHAEAVGARTTAAMMRVLQTVRATSAEARHSKTAAMLARRELFKLDAFAPAPFASVLASLGFEDTSAPFPAAWAAAQVNRGAADPVAGLVATAGIPTRRQPLDAASLSAAAPRARTPLAITHVIAAMRAAGADTDVLVRLAERLLAAMTDAGPLFVALLRWTQRWFLRDAAWRAAPTAYQLAAIWGHADRVLDVVLGGGLAPEKVRLGIESYEPAAAGVDLLLLQPAGPPDVAWPSWMSPAALLHHALAAAFGDDDFRSTLDADLAERLIEAQLESTSSIVAIEGLLLLRRSTWPNAMGSFLSASPRGLDEGGFDRPKLLRLLVGGALGVLKRDPADHGAWLQLGAFALAGMETDEAEEVATLLSADPARPVRMVAANADMAFWRTLLQPIAWRDAAMAADLMVSFATACRWLEHSTAPGGLPAIAPAQAAGEFVEIGSIIAACAGDDRENAFVNLIDRCSRAWPALTPGLHGIIGDLVARTPAGRAARLWRLQNLLGSR
ncbi:hypothetical protein [Polymorphobacter megasporae]|uniref:hypothetical protein n=1 Tax=Glacieibacterium megasporae TaxID=2835787 RepID=UPI001C1DF236|nr:hypothetical protein [Polymorphobacter megasporae]UAJ11070.1 hypothetical protein KTC28_04995 [Polymorphobacter megasporae]